MTESHGDSQSADSEDLRLKGRPVLWKALVTQTVAQGTMKTQTPEMLVKSQDKTIS